MQNPGAQATREQRTPATIGNTLIALVPLLACALGGATAKWAEAFVLVALALLLIFDPPRHSLGLWLNGIVVALLAVAALAFLPAAWFFQPAWRAILTNDFGIALPQTLSPQPWVTLECLLSFFAGLCWFYYMAARELEMRDVRQQARVFGFGIVLLALACIVLYLRHVAPPFWINERGFGPFPNRNQTGDLFGITAIVLLASGQDDFRRGRLRWILSALGFLVLGAALILNFSRAGILILLGGCAVWLAIMLFRRATAARLAVGLSLGLALLTGLLIFGGKTLERFHLRGAGTGGSISSDFRWAIFRDAWHLIQNSPWCGLGLGNFEGIFAISRVASVADTRSFHPESDWLWIWSELGWPAIALLLIGVVLLVRQVFPLKEGTNQRLRLAALVAAIFFGLHGFIDVSAHRVGTAFAGVFLLGLSLYRPFAFRSSRVVPILSRLAGLILLAAAVVWIGAVRAKIPVPGSLGADMLRKSAVIANRSRSFEDAIHDADQGLRWCPLDWQLYFQRALGKIGADKPVATSIADFRRARFLEPNGFEVPFEEGNFWLTRKSYLSITAWREALRRAGKRRAEIYGQMFFNVPRATDAFLAELTQLAGNDPELVIAGLERVSRERFPVALQDFLSHDPNLDNFSAAQKARVLSLWAERGDLGELVRTVETHPGWRAVAWSGLAHYYAGQKDFRGAAEILHQYAPPPILPPTEATASLEQLQQKFYAAPNDYGVGVALYQAQMRAGKIDDALNTARHFTEMAGSPVYFHFLEAEGWHAKQDWERAWNAWSAFLAARSR